MIVLWDLLLTWSLCALSIVWIEHCPSVDVPVLPRFAAQAFAFKKTCWFQVMAAVADAIGPELTGIRLSPFSSFLEATDPESLDLNLHLVEKLSEMGIVYVHAVEARCAATPLPQAAFLH